MSGMLSPRRGGGFFEGVQLAQQENQNRLAQFGAATTLAAALREQSQMMDMQDALASSNGDPDLAMKALLERGNLSGAARLAPVVAARRKSMEPRIIPPGSQLVGPNNEVIHTAPFKPESAPEIVRLQDAAQSLPAGDPRRSAIEARIRSLSEPDKLSPLGRLFQERDALPQGDPRRATYDRAIANFKPGGVTVQVGPQGPLTPGKQASNKVDEDLLGTTGRLLRLGEIERGFKPEFQQIAPRLSNMWSAIKEKAGTDLPESDRQGLANFASFKRTAIDNLNQYIKEITGAAMTNAEAERILRGMPNPGSGVFDGDSPTEFQAKLNDIIRQTRMAEARLVYIKRNGLSLSDANGNPTLPLERMPSLMNARGKELEGIALRSNPNANAADISRLVKRQLAQEFGLVYE